MEALGIVVLIVIIVINGIGAKKMQDACILKGYGEDYHIFAFCFWLGIFGYLYAMTLPDLITQGQNQQIIKLLNQGESRNEKVS